MRIAIGGFEHETNTFAPVEAAYADFEQADAWPPLSRGEALFEALAGINLPMTGFIEEAGATWTSGAWRPLSTLKASSAPSLLAENPR